MSDLSIIHAMVIGDGYVRKDGCICMKHSVVQKDYAEYKAHILKGFGFRVKTSVLPRNPKSYSTNDNFLVITNTTKFGKELRKKFYPNNKKVVPVEVFDDFGSQEWAILFQDDGRTNKISHYNTVIDGGRRRVECDPFVNRYEFCFPMFSDEEINAAISSLDKLGILARIGWHRKLGQRLIWISKAVGKIRFYETMRSLIVPSMKYKIIIRPTLGYKKVKQGD